MDNIKLTVKEVWQDESNKHKSTATGATYTADSTSQSHNTT